MTKWNEIKMKIHFSKKGKNYTADLARPLDISIPIRNGLENPNCFWAPQVVFEPVVAGDFVGSTERGGVVNFFNIQLNPHGNGTHTECVGHIASERFTIRECLVEHHFLAQLISVFPQKMDDGDRVILRQQIEEALSSDAPEALIIRTLPNHDSKKTLNYSGSNPPYLDAAAVEFLVERGVEHLLLDLPSVDREEDGGRLAAHRAFWKYPSGEVRQHATITELIFVPDAVRDGFYLLNLQTASFDLDVSPSKPVLFLLDNNGSAD